MQYLPKNIEEGNAFECIVLLINPLPSPSVTGGGDGDEGNGALGEMDRRQRWGQTCFEKGIGEPRGADTSPEVRGHSC